MDNDPHFVDFGMQANTDGAPDFDTSESCEGELPTGWDLERKVPGRELFCMLCAEPASFADGTAYGGGHACDTGTNPTPHYKPAANGRYGPGVA